MKTLKTKSRHMLIAAAVLFLAASTSQAEVFTGLRFTRIGSQLVAVPTTYVLLPRYQSLQSFRSSGPETWQVRLRGRSGTFTKSYRVGNSAVAIQRARRDNPNATLLSVHKR